MSDEETTTGDTGDIGFTVEPPVDRPDPELQEWLDGYIKPVLMAMDGMPMLVQHILVQYILDNDQQRDLLLLWFSDRPRYLALLGECFKLQKGKATDAMGCSKSSEQETTPEAAQDPEPDRA